jgi:hypothetical protein
VWERKETNTEGGSVKKKRKKSKEKRNRSQREQAEPSAEQVTHRTRRDTETDYLGREKRKGNEPREEGVNLIQAHQKRAESKTKKANNKNKKK